MAKDGKAITKDNLANVYLFYGPEAFKLRNYKNKLRALIAGPGSMNYIAFEGKDINLSEVYDSAVTLPFFADKRLVIVENSGLFTAKKKDEESAKSKDARPEDATSEDATPEDARPEDAAPGDAAGKAKAEEESAVTDLMLQKILDDLPPTTCLAFFEAEISQKRKSYKAVAKSGTVVRCDEDNEDRVIMWLAKGFAAAGKQVRRSTLKLMVTRVGRDYDLLRNEFEKVLAHAGERSEITDRDILSVCAENVEEKIFDMLDAMCRHNSALVLEKYHGLLINQSPPLFVLAMIRSQFRTMLQVGELAQEGLDRQEIAARLGKGDFIIRKHQRHLDYFSLRRIEEIMDEISDTDLRIKTGGIPDRLGVEMMLTEFSK
ncbi:MAG: DNA polymerase III subunit delta [Lachnospiraceae bacterium]|jgi:DNA polymerase III delta subunit